MIKSDNIKAAVMLLALAGVGYVAWKGYKTVGAMGDALSKAGDAIAQSWNDMTAAVDRTIVQPFNAGQAWVDAGQPINTERRLPAPDGPWMSDPLAAQYEASMARPPQAVSDSGAAFGIYPSAGRRTASVPVYTSTVLTDAQANDARRVFAQTDPRRIDL